MKRNDQHPQWKVHTPNLLDEIVNCSGQAILEKPIHILGLLLAKVGERAAELNDPELNALMCQLTIYEIADPSNPNHNPKAVDAIMKEARKNKRRATL